MNVHQRIICVALVLLVFVACKKNKEKETNEAPMTEEMVQPAPILVFTKTAGYRHESIEKGVATLQDLGKEHNFSVLQTEDATNFNPGFLNDFEMVIFLSTTLDVLDSIQEQAFKTFINNGGNFMGIHAATDTEYDWPWYGKLVGAYFKSHPEQQEAIINVMTTEHAATKHLDTTWTHFDEWYNYKELNPNIQVLLQLDESSYTGGENGNFHPIAWYHEFDGGRSFYTGLGHTEEAYDDANFKAHLVGGINYCLGRDH
ncbi:MAG: ThuA domain-containing protein [Muriicola sp.]|nr:ThuA domain-containing protein [Muriicola sp.]